MWPDRRLIELFKIEVPIVQAPMAGAMDWELAAAAAEAGALGSLPCAMLNAAQLREQMGKIRAHTAKPINLAFFCHTPPALNNEREARWRETLALTIASLPSIRRRRSRQATVRPSTPPSARSWKNSSRKSSVSISVCRKRLW
jgi:NAD(P)H-dependent flavin oxidoreductase YrpB (nitropropane dioxygenase family)